MIAIQDHTPNGVASMYFGGVIYRCAIILNEGISDAILKNDILNGYRYDSFYTNPINLKIMAAQAKQFNMYFIVGNLTHWFKPDISCDLFGRASGVIADHLIQLGYNKDTAAIALFNEPGKPEYCGHGIEGAKKYVSYCQASHRYIQGRFSLILVNDEYHNIDEKYIFDNTKNIPNRIFGVHHLSSLGYSPAWQNIRYAKTQANEWKVPIICTEGGSWFKEYQSAEGHAVNIKLLEECKKYDYKGCAIVCVDINKETKKRYKLGYRIWENDYSKIISDDNWGKFEEVLKIYPKEEQQMPEYNVPGEIKVVADQLGNEVGKYSEELPILTGTGIWQNAIGHKKDDFLTKGDFDATVEKILKITGIDINVYYNPDGTWNPGWEAIAKSNPKP